MPTNQLLTLIYYLIRMFNTTEQVLLWLSSSKFPGSLVVRIPRSHRGGRGSIPRLGKLFFSPPGNRFTIRYDIFKVIYLCNCLLRYVRMAEWSKALRSGRSPLLWAWVRIPLLTNVFLDYFFSTSYTHSKCPRRKTCNMAIKFRKENKKCTSGSTEIWTRIAGFRVLSANHYTIEPPAQIAHALDTFQLHYVTSVEKKKKKSPSPIRDSNPWPSD